MCKVATKAAGNMYYQARMKAAETDSRMKGRVGAAVVLGINETTLAKYELESLRVSPGMAIQMAEAYKAPELLNNYCCSQCPIGSELYEVVQIKNLESVALKAASNFLSADTIKDKLIEIAADGVIDEDEQPIFEEILAYFDKTRAIANELDLLRAHLDIKKAPM